MKGRKVVFFRNTSYMYLATFVKFNSHLRVYSVNTFFEFVCCFFYFSLVLEHKTLVAIFTFSLIFVFSFHSFCKFAMYFFYYQTSTEFRFYKKKETNHENISLKSFMKRWLRGIFVRLAWPIKLCNLLLLIPASKLSTKCIYVRVNLFWNR